MSDWGRLTLRGSEALEAQLRELLHEAKACAERFLQAHEYRALVLIGGYGRSEGGVVLEDGVERAHNNLDFLLIAESSSAADQQRLRTVLSEPIADIAKRYEIDIDVSVTSVAKLRTSPRLVIWTDMRFGHKTIAGDAAYVPNLRRYELNRIEPWDVRNLLVNRGTLLVINDFILASGRYDDDLRDFAVKLIIKAIIGYGDTLLFFEDQYHWSYAEKQKRMRQLPKVDEAFRSLYDEALEFRFAPQYDAYRQRDLSSWMDEIRGMLEPVHRHCESKRLGLNSLDWKTYPETAYQKTLLLDPLSPRAWAKKAVNLVRTNGAKSLHGSSAKLGYRMLGLRGALPMIFPIIAYHLTDEHLREVARDICNAHSTDLNELRRAYLATWAVVGDDNFESVLKKWNLSLAPTETTT